MGNITDAQGEFNYYANACRAGIEWSFKDITQNWPFVDTYRKMSLGATPCNLWLTCAVMFNNMHQVCYGGQLHSYFYGPLYPDAPPMPTLTKLFEVMEMDV